MTASSVEEHCRLAERYFSGLSDWTHHLAKPFGSFDETPQLLINFAVVLQGLRLSPGMSVMEFGAGTCWASRILTQLGCKVIACDVSATALQIGRELYSRYPPAGNRPAPEFLLFDGHRIDLEDASVERVMCLDAFHHVPNPAAAVELGRVLNDGGNRRFAEPSGAFPVASIAVRDEDSRGGGKRHRHRRDLAVRSDGRLHGPKPCCF